MDPRDEFIHDHPKDLDTPWKENWYFNFVDRKNRAWGINHISLDRSVQKGRFSAIHVVDDQMLPYSNLIDIEDLKETSDGNLTIEFIEPFKKFRVTFNGPMHQLDLMYEAHFDPFHFGTPKVTGEDKSLSVQHYRQSLIARGTITVDGNTREVESYCDRDHTWGYRNEGLLTGWNCCHAYFPDKTLIIFRHMIGDLTFGSGYLSTAEGNTRITKVEVEDTKFIDGAPVSSIFKGYDREGRLLGKLESDRFSVLTLPMEKEGVVVYENFSEFKDLESGETGEGVDEYLINPNAEYHQRPGISPDLE